jgi:hypothetical protein
VSEKGAASRRRRCDGEDTDEHWKSAAPVDRRNADENAESQDGARDESGAHSPHTSPDKCPLLRSLLLAKGLEDKGIWTINDVAALFEVGKRAIYDWIADGKLTARDLPGRGKFLSQDIEMLLRNSKKPPTRRMAGRGEE